MQGQEKICRFDYFFLLFLIRRQIVRHVLKPGRNYSVEREVDLCTYSQFVGGAGGNKCSR